MPTDPNDIKATLAYSEFAAALRDFAAAHVAHRCDVARQLDCLDLSIPPSNPPGGVAPATGTALWQSRFNQLNALWLEVVRDCICSALLPPCPKVTGANCVPLAVVTIDADTCNVIEICNWKVREFALTLPSLYYWISFVNWSAFKDFWATLCCDPANAQIWQGFFALLDSIVKRNTGSAFGTPLTGTVVLPSGGPAPAGLAAPVGVAVSGGGAAGGITPPPAGPPAGILGAMLQALAGFISQATMPDGTARLLSVAQPPLARASQEVADLHSAVAELQNTVKAQGELIHGLTAGRP
jgi:hypothetical protein